MDLNIEDSDKNSSSQTGDRFNSDLENSEDDQTLATDKGGDHSSNEEMKSCGKSRLETFACTFPNCTDRFNRMWKLNRHLCSHTGQRPFSCKVEGCSKSYQCNTHLQRHIRISHSGEKIKLPCTYPKCKSTFTSKWSLQKHCKTMHTKDLSYKCSLCSDAFEKAMQLTKHQVDAHSLKPFKCTECDASFTSTCHLVRHTKSHGIVQCEFEGCTKNFESRNLMRKHYRKEHYKVSTCEHCGKSFRNSYFLKQHMEVHVSIEDRNVICCPYSPCKRFYYQLRNLHHHIKVFHNVERLYCPIDHCSSSFTSEELLGKHMKRYHNEIISQDGKGKNIIKRILASQEHNLFSDEDREEEEGENEGQVPLDLSGKVECVLDSEAMSNV